MFQRFYISLAAFIMKRTMKQKLLLSMVLLFLLIKCKRRNDVNTSVINFLLCSIASCPVSGQKFLSATFYGRPNHNPGLWLGLGLGLCRLRYFQQIRSCFELARVFCNFLATYIFFFQVLKLYAWEESFINKITEIRNKELHHLRQSLYLNSAVGFTFICAPFLVGSNFDCVLHFA